MVDLEKKQWNCVNLEADKANGFRKFLGDSGIKYESSEFGNLIHFEVMVGSKEREMCDSYLSREEKTHG